MIALQHLAVIEDDTDIRHLLELSLTTLGGFDVTSYPLATRALAEMPQHPLPQMLLLDVMMPEMSGIEAIPRLRELAGDTPLCIVMLTAKASPEELAPLLAAGADYVASKPFDPVLLPELLQHFWSTFHGRI
ncbi:response regulator transcription factor [Chitinilyticum piscinae]|uniref:Response regulator transcription factor n=1 Tax=Chitinilyticum piscinae TaxID=2866724 RepID=A0A8J7G063_9NEIS|nr:response regulator [Chitinilyticum piscinae]MBE9609545.1 response regulator transcription factor [Chitinilyticum piscinae]